jgi:hypothetical protein
MQMNFGREGKPGKYNNKIAVIVAKRQEVSATPCEPQYC